MPKMDLNSFANGALAEKVGIEFQKLAENVSDPNTKAEAVRTLTISIKIKPDETREIAVSEMNVKSTLAPSKGIPAKFIIDRDGNGKAVIAELVSGSKNQMMMDHDGDLADDKGNKVTPEASPQDNKVVNFR